MTKRRWAKYLTAPVAARPGRDAGCRRNTARLLGRRSIDLHVIPAPRSSETPSTGLDGGGHRPCSRVAAADTGGCIPWRRSAAGPGIDRARPNNHVDAANWALSADAARPRHCQSPLASSLAVESPSSQCLARQRDQGVGRRSARHVSATRAFRTALSRRSSLLLTPGCAGAEVL